MGGVDKGLQNFNGLPLALHTLMRLQRQGPDIGPVMINANRNLAAYESFGVPVWPDSLDGFAGPLAGFLTGLERCETPYLLTVPCDTPLFPLDLVSRLAQALERENADIAMAAGRDGGPTLPTDAPTPAQPQSAAVRPQPVFCLMGVHLLESLVQFTHSGGRKIDQWTAQQRTVIVPFDASGDDPRAFFNANTLAELRALQTPSASSDP